MTQSLAHAHTLPASGSFRSPDDGGHPWPRGTSLPGGYVIERVLGQGGFAVVYEATHPEFGLVAVKVLDQSESNGEATEDRFFREAEIAAAVKHPNVLRVHELGRAHDGSAFLVMELLHGEDLSDLIERQKLDVAATVEVGLQLASALEALSEAGVVHRDLKPHNVLMHDTGEGLRAKLIDFGIATSTEDSTVTPIQKLTATGVILGTPHYLSPEQARGEELDVRADLYALGVVLYEAHCGRAPFEDGNLNALIASVLRDERPPITTFAPDCPKELEDILAKCLQRDREDRYQTPGQLLEALEAFADAEGLPRGDAALASLKVSKKMTLPWELRNLAPCERSDDRAIPVPVRSMGDRPTLGEAPAPSGVLEGSWDTRAAGTWGRDRLSDMTPLPVESRPDTPTGWRRHFAPLAAVAGVAIGVGLAGFLDLNQGPPEVHAAAAPVTAPVKANVPEGVDSAEGVEGGEDSDGNVGEAEPDDANEAVAETEAAPSARDESPSAEQPGERSPRAAPARPAPSADMLRARAHRAYVRGRLSEAHGLYRRATQLDASDAAAWRGYGLVAAQMGRKPEARRALSRYLRLAPRASDASAIRRRIATL